MGEPEKRGRRGGQCSEHRKDPAAVGGCEDKGREPGSRNAGGF